MAPSSVFAKAGVVALAAFTSSAAAAAVVAPTEYTVSDVYQGQTFFDQFNFNADVDPTHGFVDFKAQAVAKSQGLISVNTLGQAYLGVDSTTVLTDLNKRGRASVRLESKKLYNGGLFIADIAHMPSSVCGVWPAFWTSGQQNWPEDGEIDIIENISEAQQNAVTLHTGTQDCTISKAAQGGTLVTSHCSNYYADHVTQWENQGCSVQNTDSSNNYGDSFNSVGGGIYAVEWTGTTIQIWNFPRLSADGIDALSAHPDPTKWRKATITTAGGSCDVKNLFKNHNLIIDTTFCGDYAGQDVFWQATSCYKSNPTKYASCASYVAANPSKYKDAYWLINGVKQHKGFHFDQGFHLDQGFHFDQGFNNLDQVFNLDQGFHFDQGFNNLDQAPTSTDAASTKETASTSGTGDVIPTTPVSTLSSKTYSNSTVTAPTSYPTLTSTVVTTSVYTITSCAPTVTNCPLGHVTTEIITSLTTWCPGNPTYTPVPTTTPASDEYTTSTVYATSIVTITKCPQTVTDCPASSTVVVTSVYPVSTTVCPVVPLPTDSGLPSVIPPYGNNNGTVPAVPTAVPVGPTGPAGPGGPANPTKSSGPVPVQPTKPVTPVQPSSPAFGSSAGRIGASVSLLMGVAGVALLL
ncbi:hypothetical protein VE03_02276 [Pseudogymnoascus sp. 23342-1-I1]|nr:hypothetical protein VE03_02276 [Pseudogymnoascus sp. 23342-1-I1]